MLNGSWRISPFSQISASLLSYSFQPTIRTLCALEEVELNCQTTAASKTTFRKQDTFYRPSYEPQITPTPTGRTSAGPEHSAKPAWQTPSCPQPCLLTPLTNPSLSGSYSEQNLLSPARASQKRDPLAAVSARECALNQTKGDAGSPPGTPGSGSSLRAPGREVPNYIKLLRGLCFSPPPRPAFPPRRRDRPRRCAPGARTRTRPPPAPLTATAPHAPPLAPPLRLPTLTRGGGGATASQSAAQVLPAVTFAPGPRSALACYWLTGGAWPRPLALPNARKAGRPARLFTTAASRPAPFLQPASHWLRGAPHPRCDWRGLEGTRCEL